MQSRKRHLFSLIPVLTFAFSALITFGKSFPETNSLISEVKIIPPVPEIDGHFGRLVAAHSNLFVVALRRDPTSGTDTPLGIVYHKTDEILRMSGSLQLPGTTNYSIHDMATDGHRIAFSGNESSSSMDDDVPAVYIFHKVDDLWRLQSRLALSKSAGAISISGDVIVVGSVSSALVLKYTGGEWVESEILLPPGSAPSVVRNGFGADVAVSNGTVLIGARGEIRTDPGRAYIFGAENESWKLQAELLPEPFIFTPFGNVVALEGDTALISAYPNRFNSGMVYLFRRSGGVWSRTGILQGDTQDFFGQSLSVSGRNLVVGSSSAMNGSGGVYLFRENGLHIERLKLYREDLKAMPGDALGYSVAVDGNSIIAGAPFHDGYAENAGLAVLFEFKFSPWLHSPWARAGDRSFHFTVSDALAGVNYRVETASDVDSEWLRLYEFRAEKPDTELHVDLKPESGGAFFRVVAQ